MRRSDPSCRCDHCNLPRTIFGMWLYMKLIDIAVSVVIFFLFWFVLVPFLTRGL